MKAGTFKVLQFAKPIIRMPYELRAQLMALVNGTNHNECQWFHCITKSFGGAKKEIIYYDLDGIYIPKQVVGGASVESPGEGLLGIWNELKAVFLLPDGTPDREQCNLRFQKMNCWAHSHVNMAVNPSPTDESTFRQWVDQSSGTVHPTIMMIVNKREEVYIRLYDPEEGIYCENPEIIMLNPPPVDLTYIQDAIANKISSRTYTSTGMLGNTLGFGKHHQLGLVRHTDDSQKKIQKTVQEIDLGIQSTKTSGDVPTTETIQELIQSGKRLCKNKINFETHLSVVQESNDNEISANALANELQEILLNFDSQKIFLLLLDNFYIQTTPLLDQILAFWQNKETDLIQKDELNQKISQFLQNEYLGPSEGFFASIVLAKRIVNILEQSIDINLKIKIIKQFLHDLDFVIVSNTDFSSSAGPI